MQWVKGLNVPGASAKRLSCVTVGCAPQRLSTTGVRQGPRKLWVTEDNELLLAGIILTELRRQAYPAPWADLTVKAVRV